MSSSQHRRGINDDSDKFSSNLEAESLILHRLETDPRSGQPRITTIPSTRHDGNISRESDASDQDDVEEQTDETLEKRRIKALSRQGVAVANATASSDSKTGQSTWLLGAVNTFRCLPTPFKLASIALSAALLGGLFYFALGTSGAQRIWHYGSDAWTGGSIPYTFPSDVGYPGPTATGAPAQLEEEDRLTGTRPSPGLPVETYLGGQYGTFNPL